MSECHLIALHYVDGLRSGQKVPEVKDDSEYPAWVHELVVHRPKFTDLMNVPFNKLTPANQVRTARGMVCVVR